MRNRRVRGVRVDEERRRSARKDRRDTRSEGRAPGRSAGPPHRDDRARGRGRWRWRGLYIRDGGLEANVTCRRYQRIDDLFGAAGSCDRGDAEGDKPSPERMRAKRNDRHAARAQRIHGLGRQVGVGAVDDCQVRDPRAAGSNDLSEVRAATNDREGLPMALYCMDEGRFVSLIGEDNNPVNGTHGAPTGTAARPSVEL